MKTFKSNHCLNIGPVGEWTKDLASLTCLDSFNNLVSCWFKKKKREFLCVFAHSANWLIRTTLPGHADHHESEMKSWAKHSVTFITANICNLVTNRLQAVQMSIGLHCEAQSRKCSFHVVLSFVAGLSSLRTNGRRDRHYTSGAVARCWRLLWNTSELFNTWVCWMKNEMLEWSCHHGGPAWTIISYRTFYAGVPFVQSRLAAQPCPPSSTVSAASPRQRSPIPLPRPGSGGVLVYDGAAGCWGLPWGTVMSEPNSPGESRCGAPRFFVGCEDDESEVLEDSIRTDMELYEDGEDTDSVGDSPVTVDCHWLVSSRKL